MLGIKETMNKSIEILEEAISDVGYWRWWAEKLPDVFQVEFGGVQLWNPPTNPDGPPSGIVALRFIKPTVIAFLTENGASDIQDNWPASLHDDSIDSFTVDCDRFTFTSETEISETLQNCSVELKFGTQEDLYSLNSPVKLAFRAENVGLLVRAEKMTVISSAGEMSKEHICDAHAKWWEYWREYWRRRNSEDALPKDYACEVTIPVRED